MNYDNTISAHSSGTVPRPVPEFEVSTAPPPPPAAKLTADFAASAAMAKDILAIGNDGLQDPAPPPPPHGPATSAQLPADDGTPLSVPDLDFNYQTPELSAVPMAPDFFTSSRPKSKKRVWKISR